MNSSQSLLIFCFPEIVWFSSGDVWFLSFSLRKWCKSKID